MRTFPVLISAILIGETVLVFWLGADFFSTGRTTEDTLTLLYCTGDRFAFIRGTYLSPVTGEEIEAERAAVIQRVRATGGLGPRAGGVGGGGPGDPRIIAWGIVSTMRGFPQGSIMVWEMTAREKMLSKHRTAGIRNILSTSHWM
ncbi:MAG TPA: hypothetical protein PLM60_00355 [Methanoregulaceae archaeon]|nr:hypothetical protein [Methanoregulaceae archaeon]